VVISSDHLDPGVVGRVKATVATANIIGPSLKHISVYSNDRTTPVLTVEVAINVVPDDAAQPLAKPVVAAPTGTAPK
jgi:NADH/NAD ratio-sensing transcriptional regulator Rex